jgi:nucleoside-diphosphate-sugar epimerase
VRILVTGSSGLVGGAIASHLLAQGHEVIGLSRGLSKAARRLPRAIAVDIGRAGAAGVIALEQRCDAIVHAAAATDSDPYAPSISVTNGLGTQQMLELAARWRVESFVFLSSVPVIGRPTSLPITEQHCADPRSAYHASKLYGELLLSVARRDGLPTLSLRLTAPVGPGMPADRILAVFVRRALSGEPLEVAGGGTREQDYVDVRDVATAVEASVKLRATGLLNIGSGRSVSNLDLARRCVEAVGSSSEVRLSGVPDDEDGVRWEVSIAAAESALGYRPRYSLEDSITTVAEQLRKDLVHG